MEGPRLTEYGATNYMHNVLQKCHENRVNIYIYVLNISILILFCIVFYKILTLIAVALNTKVPYPHFFPYLNQPE